ncbi:MAG: hypothetical protein A2W37_00840 [Chloroflexi bacterium RBG_16_63_12]|jgi:CHASE3 domain sensor protein|nr:hypothetical protein [Anaerolineales bacterium]MBM2848332.1 hypothetical protein [Anaerolineales bacterium]OGO45060.1 MAG: hypothetical protein A2W37_00840 [Chloroflexi bacterium RBG_16_63_12]
MHHPVQYETMAKIKQAELLREAAERRAARDARANTSRPTARWLVIALAIGALAIGLVLLTGMI